MGVVDHNIVTSAGVLNKGKAKLKDLTDRMDKHADYYQDHDMIRSAFGFLKKIIEAWYLTEDPENNRMQLQRKSVCFCGAVLQKCDMALFFC